ncbi:MAG: hypothetical protein ACLPIX_22515 [Rhodomicrobium sp.]
MTNESPPESPPAKFSKDGRIDWLHTLPEAEPELTAPSRGAEMPAPLADLIEHVMTGQAIRGGEPEGPAPAAAIAAAGFASSGTVGALPGKLIEELSAAQARLWLPPPPPPGAEENVHETAGDAAIVQVPPQPASVSAEKSLADAASLPDETAAASKQRIAARFQPRFEAAGAALGRAAQASAMALRRVSRRMRAQDWQRRYFILLSHLHRNVFDRGIERLLFIKTPGHQTHSDVQPGDGGRKTFRYRGPIPGKALDWALSALPADLKRYAFADFRAGNGRTLLLAARRNFEHALGYAFDTESCEVLELNLAQYSRSYMRCRDVRALRGDRDGIAIPPQPAVLFFPDCLSASHLGIVLSHVAASLKTAPRPVYLVFENSGRECSLDQMRIFEKVPLPILSRVKAYLFSPAKIAVYKSLNDASAA